LSALLQRCIGWETTTSSSRKKKKKKIINNNKKSSQIQENKNNSNKSNSISNNNNNFNNQTTTPPPTTTTKKQKQGLAIAAAAQVGGDIDGETSFDESSQFIDLSVDGSILTIGAIKNDGTGASSRGHVRIYQNVNDQWIF